MKVLLTGAAGFVGHHALEHWLVNTDWTFVCPVTYRHRGSGDRLNAVCGTDERRRRVDIIHHDLTMPPSAMMMRSFEADVIVNVASQSHVDRSITDPVPFVQNNVALELQMLEIARAIEPRLFVQVSTDEVYGPAPEDYRHAEWDTILPSNPYSASKAAQEAIAISYWRTYGVPLVITNTMNIIGERQHPEKFVPSIIRNLRDSTPVTVHTDVATGEFGSRFYLHARSQADALGFVMTHAQAGNDRPGRLNIVGEREVNNREMVEMIAEIMGVQPTFHYEDFHATRPGHDRRYALDGRTMAAAGWKAPVPFEEALERTVRWTLAHPEWLADG